ncbi:MAG: 4-hydroxy-tetrahydrodipicolinate synthase [Bacteroidota bacterium]
MPPSPLPFSGTGVALITPFDQHGQIDFESLNRCIDHVIQGGVDYIVSLGTTGEAVTLSTAECIQVLEHTKNQVANRVPLVAGCFGDNHTARLLEKVRDWPLDGFAAIMSSSPSYNKPSQEGLYQHFRKLSDASPLPIIVYNVPSRTGGNVLPETILRLAEEDKKIVAIKEASGTLDQATEILRHRPDHLAVLSGDDPLTLPMISIGGHGSISVLANALPKMWSDMVSAARHQDFTTAREIHLSLWPLHGPLYADGNPSGIKALTAHLGLGRESFRLPLVGISDSVRRDLFTAFEKISR